MADDCCDDLAKLSADYRVAYRQLHELIPAYEMAEGALMSAYNAWLSHRCVRCTAAHDRSAEVAARNAASADADAANAVRAAVSDAHAAARATHRDTHGGERTHVIGLSDLLEAWDVVRMDAICVYGEEGRPKLLQDALDVLGDHFEDLECGRTNVQKVV